MGTFLLVLSIELNSACRLSLLQCLLITPQHLILQFCSLIATSLCLFLHTGNTSVDCLKVLQLKFIVDYFLVTHRIYRAIDMHHIRVVETTQHMDYSIRFTYIGKKLITEPLSFRRSFHQTGNIHNLDRSRHYALRINNLGKTVQSLIGHCNHAHIRLYSTKRKIRRLCLCIGKAIEKSGLPHIRKPYDTTLKCHISLYF